MKKQEWTLRLDEEMLAWLKVQGLTAGISMADVVRKLLAREMAAPAPAPAPAPAVVALLPVTEAPTIAEETTVSDDIAKYFVEPKLVYPPPVVDPHTNSIILDEQEPPRYESVSAIPSRDIPAVREELLKVCARNLPTNSGSSGAGWEGWPEIAPLSPEEKAASAESSARFEERCQKYIAEGCSESEAMLKAELEGRTPREPDISFSR